MLYTDFEAKYNVKSDRIRAVIPVSGVFDLRPLIHTDVNDNLKMDLNEASELSPLLRSAVAVSEEKRKSIKLVIAYGAEESPAFKSQSKDFFNVIFLFSGFQIIN
jgi:arylformamidase